MKWTILLLLLPVIWCGCTENPIGPDPPAAPGTAAKRLSEVNSLAASYNKGLRLVTVSAAEVNIHGLSDTWHYQYVDTAAPHTAYWFHANFLGVGFDSNSVPGLGIEVISHTWFDSDSAMGIAEENGGLQFRTENPNYCITATLGEPLVPDAATTWWITYRSTDDNSSSLLFGINATSGSVNFRYPE